MKNKYVNRAKISEKQFMSIIQLFSLDLDASQISELTKINRNTINRYVKEIRLRIAEHCQLEPFSCPSGGWIEDKMPLNDDTPVDSWGDTLFLGVTSDNGKIRSRIIPENECQKIRAVFLKRKRSRDAPIEETLKSYGGLIDLPRMKYVRLTAGVTGTSRGPNGIDVCSGFWGIARSRLHRFRGLKKSTLLLHIKECEFRYNHNRTDLYPLLLQLFEERPLFH
jgi:transposase